MKLRKKDIGHFSRQLSTLLQAGVPLLNALEIIKNATPGAPLHSLIISLKNSLELGNSFSEALTKHPRLFDNLYISLIRTGEAAGQIETMLAKMASFQEKQQKLNKKIKKALMYPVVVMSMGIVVTFLMLLYIVPQFEKLYVNFSVTLPLFTQCVLSVAKFLQTYGLIALSITTGLICFLSFYKRRSKRLQQQLDRLLLKVPLYGELLKKVILARFSSTFATTFQAGVPLIDCLGLVAKACHHSLYCVAIEEIKQQIIKGTSLYQAMRLSPLFPPFLSQMIAVGEGSGQLHALLEKTAEYYQGEVEMTVETLSQLIEPFIMMILGILVGSLVIAMYLPLFKLGTII